MKTLVTRIAEGLQNCSVSSGKDSHTISFHFHFHYFYVKHNGLPIFTNKSTNQNPRNVKY